MTSHRPTDLRPDGAPEPRLAALWATLTYALCTLALAWPALTGGFLVNPRSDQYIGGFPVRDFAGQALKAGQGIPQWNPYLFGGLPYVAAMHGDIFYPTALLRLLLPTDVGLTWGFVLHLFLAGCFTYGFLRAWGVSFLPSLGGGVAYMLSGQVASLVSPGHDGKLFVSALLPLTCWLLIRGVRDGRWWSWGALALTVGLAVLSPHPQLLQYLLLTAGAFALYIALTDHPGRAPLTRRDGVTRIALALGAVLVGFAIGAVQYLPVVEYVPFSPRAGGRGYEYVTTYSMPIEELINTYLPQFSGLLEKYWGRNRIHLHSEYLGVVVLMLATAAFGGESRKSFRRFWLGTGIIALLWALGGYTPFYHLIYALVPGSKFFRAPSTIFYVVSFAVSVFSALGLERALAGALTRRWLLGWITGAFIVAILATGGFFTSLGQIVGQSFAGGQLDDLIASNKRDVVLGAWRSFVFVALAAGMLLAHQRRALDVRMLGAALIGLIAIDLWTIDRHYWMFSAGASVLYAPDAATEYLRTAEPGRVLVLPNGREGIADRDPNYSGDGLMVHRVRLVMGYHGNELGRYQRIASRDEPGDYGNIVNPAFWRLQNVRYLYTNAVVEQPGFQRLLGPVKNSAGSTVYLYRVPGDNPPAWVVPALVKAGDDATLGTVLDPRFDPLRVGLVDSAWATTLPPITALPPAIGIAVAATRYDAGHIELTLASPAPAGAALVVSENFFPGWRATVDGKPADVVRTDYNLLGVSLRAGARKVSVDFADPAYGPGRAVSLAATVLALLATLAGGLAERRRHVA